MGGACHLHGHHVHFQIWRHWAAGLKGRLMVTPQMDKYWQAVRWQALAATMEACRRLDRASGIEELHNIDTIDLDTCRQEVWLQR
jgi:hypothetical protein